MYSLYVYGVFGLSLICKFESLGMVMLDAKTFSSRRRGGRYYITNSNDVVVCAFLDGKEVVASGYRIVNGKIV